MRNDLYEAICTRLLEKARRIRIKSNDPMPALSKKNISAMMDELTSWKSKHKFEALEFANHLGHLELFELLHSMRRWYSGQTKQWTILSYRDELMNVMELEPEDVLGIYRGIRVPRDNLLADVNVGDEIYIENKRNNEFSAWSVEKEPTNRFSGKSKENVGLIFQLISTENVVPVFAPPTHTDEWFNKMYERLIGKSFRPTEGEYLLFGSPLKVRIVEVKR